MNILTFSDARAGFKRALNAVCKNHEPTIVTRQRGKHIVMMSLDDDNSMQETLYMLGSRKNAERLSASIAEFNAGKTVIKDLLRYDATAENQKHGRHSE